MNPREYGPDPDLRPDDFAERVENPAKYDPPDYMYPVECPKCLGAGCLLNDQYAMDPYRECPRCRGRGSVAA